MQDRRVPTGIKGLDDMLSGGFIPGTAVLVRGAPGTGKTSLGLQYLIHGATKCDEKGLLVSFEEFPQALYRDAQSLGWDLEHLQQENKIHILFTSPQVLLGNLQAPVSPLNRLLMDNHFGRVVVDSVSSFRRITSHPWELRHVYNVLVNAFKREGLTSVLIDEESRASYGRGERDRLSFVVDTIILMRYIEIDSAIQRGIIVLKMRGSDHAKEIRRYEIKRGGIQIADVFEGREAILSGTPYRVHASSRR